MEEITDIDFYLIVWLGIVSLLLIYDLWFTDHCLSRVIKELKKANELVKELLSDKK
jgi:hypothetical protein